jgi:hypothetical protein
VRVVVCLRRPDDFLRSYRGTLARRRESPSRYFSSQRYVEPDTWLVDYEALLDVYRRAFGRDSVSSLAYEDAIAEHGSTIPGVLTALGIDPGGLPGWDSYRANVTPSPPGLLRRTRRRAALVKRALLEP